MAVDNVSLIDAIANDKENACLVLLITDHLNWDNEFEHLKILQDKINAYVAFIESEQYDEIYPNADFKMKKKWYGKIFILKNIIIGGTKNGVIRTVWKKKRS